MAYYFKHDDNARRDPKIIRLLRIKGMKGYGIYWALVEILHEQNGKLTFKEISDIAFELREDENNILSVIKEFDLFVIRENEIGNTRVSESLEERHSTSKKNSDAVNKRWAKERAKNQIVNTSVIPNTYERNTIIEDKRIEENRREYKAAVLKQDIWIEEVCMKFRLKKEQLPEILDTFISNCKIAGDTHETERDFKQHFRNWGLKMGNNLIPKQEFKPAKIGQDGQYIR
jgi:uncharacterized protein YdaU (DUF1376 family)